MPSNNCLRCGNMIFMSRVDNTICSHCGHVNTKEKVKKEMKRMKRVNKRRRDRENKKMHEGRGGCGD